MSESRTNPKTPTKPAAKAPTSSGTTRHPSGQVKPVQKSTSTTTTTTTNTTGINTPRKPSGTGNPPPNAVKPKKTDVEPTSRPSQGSKAPRSSSSSNDTTRIHKDADTVSVPTSKKVGNERGASPKRASVPQKSPSTITSTNKSSNTPKSPASGNKTSNITDIETHSLGGNSKATSRAGKSTDSENDESEKKLSATCATTKQTTRKSVEQNPVDSKKSKSSEIIQQEPSINNHATDVDTTTTTTTSVVDTGSSNDKSIRGMSLIPGSMVLMIDSSKRTATLVQHVQTLDYECFKEFPSGVIPISNQECPENFVIPDVKTVYLPQSGDAPSVLGKRGRTVNSDEQDTSTEECTVEAKKSKSNSGKPAPRTPQSEKKNAVSGKSKIKDKSKSLEGSTPEDVPDDFEIDPINHPMFFNCDRIKSLREFCKLLIPIFDPQVIYDEPQKTHKTLIHKYYGENTDWVHGKYGEAYERYKTAFKNKNSSKGKKRTASPPRKHKSPANKPGYKPVNGKLPDISTSAKQLKNLVINELLKNRKPGRSPVEFSKDFKATLGAEVTRFLKSIDNSERAKLHNNNDDFMEKYWNRLKTIAIDVHRNTGGSGGGGGAKTGQKQQQQQQHKRKVQIEPEPEQEDEEYHPQRKPTRNSENIRASSTGKSGNSRKEKSESEYEPDKSIADQQEDFDDQGEPREYDNDYDDDNADAGAGEQDEEDQKMYDGSAASVADYGADEYENKDQQDGDEPMQDDQEGSQAVSFKQ